MKDIAVGSATPKATYANLDDLCLPILGRIGPSSAYARSLDAAQADLRAEHGRRLGVGDEPLELSARAWLASGEVA